jgi:hypothetical protein
MKGKEKTLVAKARKGESAKGEEEIETGRNPGTRQSVYGPSLFAFSPFRAFVTKDFRFFRAFAAKELPCV